MINWYNEVSRNLDKIPDCIAYFDKELLEAKELNKEKRTTGNKIKLKKSSVQKQRPVRPGKLQRQKEITASKLPKQAKKKNDGKNS